MKSCLNLIGEVLLDTQAAFLDVLLDNEIVEEFTCCTQFIRIYLKNHELEPFNQSEYCKRIMPIYMKYIGNPNEINQPNFPIENEIIGEDKWVHWVLPEN